MLKFGRFWYGHKNNLIFQILPLILLFSAVIEPYDGTFWF